MAITDYYSAYHGAVLKVLAERFRAFHLDEQALVFSLRPLRLRGE